ncbi:CUN074 putative p74 envelope protein, similar to AcMNPV ORF138 [Culex nigripalpus nucleopolyhedrovirus]|uniref:CUN074 putative p74 envelope protein, similar to AcMNPV ORF138 n=2 Tax=Deltabaculovirus TaxID=558019 RepID=Q919K2_NPVCO|nr:CUN074 putative p74 envelope protein, similar to AcMNPV ORF138 [Culex nigripalpus nucleopolyhedrovirus]AAK94152.1 CUN074 putative p74 envelope protein, similar to AcMNPV ORF138 [Culex nigripalpus nucleopolyhedrovirus]
MEFGASLTAVDLATAGQYVWNVETLRYILRFRKTFPNLPINYTFESAVGFYYVPDGMKHNAVNVQLGLSEEGCKQANCFPFTETGVIAPDTPFRYLQTTENPVGSGHPACYGLDPTAAFDEDDEPQVQSMETRWHKGRCIVMDSMAKQYFISPFVRTEHHLQRGIDDVPGFNVEPTLDDIFPETFDAKFNRQYCDYFMRQLDPSGGCTFQWWETLVGAVLGDSIYATFRGFIRELSTGMQQFDFKRPHRDLPTAPVVNPEEVREAWRRVRDSTIPHDLEVNFSDPTRLDLDKLGLGLSLRAIYVANRGLTFEPRTDSPEREFRETRRPTRHTNGGPIMRLEDEPSLEDQMIDFINNNPLISSLLVSAGFDFINDGFRALMKKAMVRYIPMLQAAAIRFGEGLTRKMVSEAFRVLMFSRINQMAVQLTGALAKAIARFGAMASSVIGIVLIFFVAADIILMFWDPYGYSNMFPPEFLGDLTLNFLSAFFEQTGTRNVIEMIPQAYDSMVKGGEEDGLYLTFAALQYVSHMEVNSDGQLLLLRNSNPIKQEELEPHNLTVALFGAINLQSYEDLKRHMASANRAFGIDPETLQQVAPWRDRPGTVISAGVLVALVVVLTGSQLFSTKAPDLATVVLIVILVAIVIIVLQLDRITPLARLAIVKHEENEKNRVGQRFAGLLRRA